MIYDAMYVSTISRKCDFLSNRFYLLFKIADFTVPCETLQELWVLSSVTVQCGKFWNFVAVTSKKVYQHDQDERNLIFSDTYISRDGFGFEIPAGCIEERDWLSGHSALSRLRQRNSSQKRPNVWIMRPTSRNNPISFSQHIYVQLVDLGHVYLCQSW